MSAVLSQTGLVFNSGTATITGCNSMTVNNSPTNNTDVANKGYVDTVAEGLHVLASVRLASTSGNGNITLSGTQTVDDKSTVNGNRVLIKNQTDKKENGIYVCSSSGTWSRSSDMTTGDNASSDFTFVEEGTTNEHQGFVCTSDNGSAVVGTNDLEFTQFSGAGSITAGTNLIKTGNEISFDPNKEAFNTNKATSLAINEGSVNIASSGEMTTIKGSLNVDEAVTLDSTLGISGTTSIDPNSASGEALTISNTQTQTSGELVKIEGTPGQIAFKVDQGFSIFDDGVGLHGGVIVDPDTNSYSGLEIKNSTQYTSDYLAKITANSVNGKGLIIGNDSTQTTDELVRIEGTGGQTAMDIKGKTHINADNASGSALTIMNDQTQTSGELVRIEGTGNQRALDIKGNTYINADNASGYALTIGNDQTQTSGELFKIHGDGGQVAMNIEGKTHLNAINSSGDALLITNDQTQTSGELVNIQGTGGQIAMNIKGTTHLDAHNASGSALTISNYETQTSGELVRIDGTVGQTALQIGNGNLQVNKNSNLDGTLDVHGVVNFNNTTQSTSTTSGALIVDGGVGIAKDVFIAGVSTASSHVSSSDRRLKKNIKVIKDCLGKVKKIRGVNFTWIKDGSKDFGVIAQEIEKVAPFAVKESEDGMKKVDYGRLAPLFIQSIKEQQQIIEDQQDEIDGLKEQFEDLKAKVAELAK